MRELIVKLLAFLRVRAVAAGLEVSDQVMRLVYFDGRNWQLHAVRLAPGVLESDNVKDRAAFAAALAALKEKVQGRRKGKTMNVVACLSSAGIYTQTFSLPAVSGKDLAEAVSLNLKMASPAGGDASYDDWQAIGRDEATAQTKIFAAFVDRTTVDGIADALFAAGFLPMAVESRALALARMLRAKGAGIDVAKAYLFVNVDNAGIDFLIVRNGALSFEYAEPWRGIADEKGEIAMARFTETIAAGIRQVLNFYDQHWPSPIASIILSSPAFAEEVEKAARETAPATPVVRLTLVMEQPISSEWLAALGCSLRSGRGAAHEHEISLLGVSSVDRFREEQLLVFLRFWRAAVPAALGILLLTFGAADFFLHSTKSGVEARSDFNVGATTEAQSAALESAAQSFNKLVALTAAAEGAIQPKSFLLEAVAAAAASNHITVDNIAFQSFGSPVTLSGRGLSQNDVTAFKAALAGIAGVSNVNLPLQGMQTNGSAVSFSLTFSFSVAPPGIEPGFAP